MGKENPVEASDPSSLLIRYLQNNSRFWRLHKSDLTPGFLYFTHPRYHMVIGKKKYLCPLDCQLEKRGEYAKASFSIYRDTDVFDVTFSLNPDKVMHSWYDMFIELCDVRMKTFFLSTFNICDTAEEKFKIPKDFSESLDKGRDYE